MKQSQKYQFLEDFLIYFLTALTCSLLLTSPFWFPYLCSSIQNFLFVSLPKLGLLLFSPKILFIVGNLIVIILVGESKFFASTGNVYYNEHVSKSRSPHQKPSFDSGGDKKILRVENESEGSGEKSSEDGDDRVVKRGLVTFDYQIHTSPTVPLNHYAVPEYRKNRIKIREKIDLEKIKVEELDGEDEFACPAEELSKRADDFIARVNRQRRLEASLLLCGGELER